MKQTDIRLTIPGRHGAWTREQWRWLYYFGYRDNWRQVTLVCPSTATLRILADIRERKPVEVVIINIPPGLS
jgi:hypothetical protein